MDLLMEFAIILGVSLAAELVHAFIPLPIPASIYGMTLMLALLISGVLKLEKVRRAGNFLLKIMPVMFIPAAVGLMDVVPAMKDSLLPIACVIVLTTVVVMVVTGRTAERMINKESDNQ